MLVDPKVKGSMLRKSSLKRHDGGTPAAAGLIRLAVTTAVIVCGCGPQSPASKPAAVEPAREIAANQKATPAPKAPTGRLPRFQEVSRELGVVFRRYDDIRGQHRLLEANGGGVAMLDFDGDGRLDLFFTNGCELPRKSDDQRHVNALYRNAGKTFEDVGHLAGVNTAGYFQGCATADYDADGFEDLYVTAYGRNVLWHNNGDGTFSDVTSEAGVECGSWSSSAAFADFNLDGCLDLFVTTYVQADDDPPLLCPNPASPDGYVQCAPAMFPAADDFLFLGDGAGRFRDVTKEAGIVGLDGKGLGVVVLDTNGDRAPDIFVANDGTPNFLYMNVTDLEESSETTPRLPRFQERAVELGVAANFYGETQACMGIAAGDYDNDEWYDLLVTNFHGETNTLYRNLEGKGFEDNTNVSGVGPPSRSTLGFGTEFIDVDNDGWLDLFVSNGHVDDRSWNEQQEPYRMPPQFFRNESNGRFTDVSRWSGDYFKKKWLGRGVALGDLDEDGDLDLVVSHQLSPSAVLRNDTQTAGRSITIKLIGRGTANRTALHAALEGQGLDYPVTREVIGGGSFHSASDRRVHIGLGDHRFLPMLRITWPSGRKEQWENVQPGSYVAVEGQTFSPAPWSINPSARN